MIEVMIRNRDDQEETMHISEKHIESIRKFDKRQYGMFRKSTLHYGYIDTLGYNMCYGIEIITITGNKYYIEFSSGFVEYYTNDNINISFDEAKDQRDTRYNELVNLL